MNIAVLGCGPAGLLAAHAAVLNGHTPTIYTDIAQPSRIGGAQFLHRAIPGVTLDHHHPDALCEFIFMGSGEGYARKVYGDPRAPTSWGSYRAGLHTIWNMQAAYDVLWERYNKRVTTLEVDKHTVYRMEEEVIFSCIPATVLCDHMRNENGAIKTCDFTSQQVWIVQDRNYLERGTNQIVYNGYPAQRWYRWSSLFGTSFFEYPFKPTEDQSAVRVVKPLSTTCPGPARSGVYRMGRYGSFKKTALIHHAYEEAMEVLSAL